MATLRRFGLGVSAVLLLALRAGAQAPAAVAPGMQIHTAAEDVAVSTVRQLMGRALLLRCQCGGSEIHLDSTGKLLGTPTPLDWTLVGFDLLTVERTGPDAVRLEGQRVAARFNPDSRIFERHAIKDEPIAIIVALPAQATAEQTKQAMNAAFAVGIDPGMLRAMSPAWHHYFDPAAVWPQDALTGATIYGLPGQPGATVDGKDVAPAVAINPLKIENTLEAVRDRVKGAGQYRFVIDANGQTQHISIARPIGYGLDERVVAALAQWRFKPATLNGVPVASLIVVNQPFDLSPVAAPATKPAAAPTPKQ